MDARCLNSRKEARQTLLIWSCMERVWSILTPRYFTEVLRGILLPLMFAKLQSIPLRWDEVPTAITSVLSLFNISLLLLIQDKMSSIHVWMPVCTEPNSSEGLDTQLHSSSLFNNDQSVHYEVCLSPSSFSLSPLSSCRLDLLIHLQSGGVVSNMPGNRQGMVVENLCSPS